MKTTIGCRASGGFRIDIVQELRMRKRNGGLKKSGIALGFALLAMSYMPGRAMAQAGDQERIVTLEEIEVVGQGVSRMRTHGGTNFLFLFTPGAGRGGAFASNTGNVEGDLDSKTDDCKRGNASIGEAKIGANENGTSGNPILLSTGNKIENELDFATGGEFGLFLSRTYNHYWNGTGLFGRYWQSNFDYKLTFGTSQINTCYPRPAAPGTCTVGTQTKIWSLRPDGRRIAYIKNTTDGIFYEDKPQAVSKIVKQADGSFKLYGEEGEVETYTATGYVSSVKNAAGVGWTFTHSGTYLQKVTHTSGRFVEFFWTGSQLTSVKDPAGNTYSYTYTANQFGTNLHRLATATKPGTPGTLITYHYEVAGDPSALTGKSFNGTRHSWFTYNAAGYATSSQHPNTQDRYTFTYTPGANGQLTVVETNPLGKQTTYGFRDGNPETITGHSSAYCAATYAETAYDSNGYPLLKSDFNGNDTQFTYNAKGQLLTKIEGYGTALARKTTYTWDATKNRVLTVKVGGTAAGTDLMQTTYTYTADDRIASVSTKNLSTAGVLNQTRTTTFAYTKHANGMLATAIVDGPLAGDTVTLTYDNQGNLLTEKNGLNHTTTYAYGTTTSATYKLGLPVSVTSPNGGVVEYTYDARGRVMTAKTYVTGTAATTTYAYDGVGYPKSTTYPDGTMVDTNYITTGRLISVKQKETGAAYPYALQQFDFDADGNVMNYTISRATQTEQWQQPPCTLPPPGCWPGGEPPPPVKVTVTAYTPRFKSYADFDELSRPRASRGNNGQNVRYTYDGNGNLRTVIDALGRGTTYYYDVLGRVIRVKDALNGDTRFTYDLLDRVTQVTDPRGNVTSYTYDGFGQLWSQTSPDTGTTTFTYSSTGNLTSMTRNDGVVTTFGYDAQGRRVHTTVGELSQTFGYDSCSNGKGMLCTMTDPSGGTVALTYNAYGQLLSRHDRIQVSSLSNDWTYYAYDSRGRLTSLTYPDGTVANYTYAYGRLKGLSVTIGGVAQTVATVTAHEPFGPDSSWTLGNGLIRIATRDLDWRTATLSTKNGAAFVQHLGFTYNAGNEITQLGNSVNTALTQGYTYDGLSRLASVTASGANQSWTHDAVGNRATHTWGGLVDTYNTSTASNRLTSISGPRAKSLTTNMNGQITANAGKTYAYDGFNRLVSASMGGSVLGTYVVNAQGQRSSKKVGSTYTRFVYAGQNQMLAENTSAAWSNYLWFNGELIGIVRGGQLYYSHNDQLGRPEVVTNSAKTVVWRANNYAYDRTVTVNSFGGLNLGFPGQYYDSESGLWNNGFRDYDATLGRYVHSDPVGLNGGLNTYSYASGNPVLRVDPLGLTDWIGTGLETGLIAAGASNFQLTNKCTGQGEDRYFVNVRAGGPDSSTLSKRLSFPVTYVGSNVTFSDSNSLPDPNVFNGEYASYSIGASPGVGVGFGNTRLGSASTGWGFGMLFGVKLAAGASAGISQVTAVTKIGKCPCDSN